MSNKIAEEAGYNILFHFNSYTGKWNAFQRDDSKNYFNGWNTKAGIGDRILGVGDSPDAAASALKASIETK